MENSNSNSNLNSNLNLNSNNEEYINISRLNIRNVIENNISKFKFSEINNPLNNYCAITQDNFQPLDEVALINNCEHIFNYNALFDWLIEHQTCPCCRYNILTNSNLIKYFNPITNQTYYLLRDEFRRLIARDIITTILSSNTENNENNENNIDNVNTNNVIAFRIIR